MKILIVAGIRVGGTRIGEWLGFELGIEYIHEPFSDWRIRLGREISPKNSIKYKREGFVVKVLHGPELEQILIEHPKWDKIIGLVRENETECAISLTRADEIKQWHEEYYVDEKWLKEKESDIKKMEESVVGIRNEILSDNRIECQITYEGIYHSKSDRDKLKEYLSVDKWRFEEMLNPKYRYRKSAPDEKSIRKVI